MELLVKRKVKTPNSTMGDFSINGEYFCHCLEDPDRGLTSDMPIAEIQAKKEYGNTAIPTGRYQVTKYFSPKHNATVPLVLHVPGFDGVEIHVGNYPKDTLGCLLLGNTLSVDFVGDSKTAIAKFYELFFAAIDKGENVWIVYE